MMIDYSQPGILSPLPVVGRSLTFRIAPGVDPRSALKRLRDGFALDRDVIGVGEPVARALGQEVEGVPVVPGISGPACCVPSTQQGLWRFLRGQDRGGLFDLTEQIRSTLDEAFVLDRFVYAGGRDFSGYEDGTENPGGHAAIDEAIVPTGKDLMGSSSVAVQRWEHDLGRFRSFPSDRRDAIFGRRADTNAEIEDPPVSAHVKRSAQESYDPPAFMVRRSIPWANAHQQEVGVHRLWGVSRSI